MRILKFAKNFGLIFIHWKNHPDFQKQSSLKDQEYISLDITDLELGIFDSEDKRSVSCVN